MKIYKILFLIAFALCSNTIFSSVITYSDTNEINVIGMSTEILEDPSDSMTISEVLQSKSFIKSTLEVPNLAVSNSSFWIKFDIKNKSSKESFFLDLSYPLMDLVELYTLKPNGDYVVESLGDNKKFSERTYSHQHYIFKLTVPKDETQSYLLKIRSHEQILVPLSIGSEKQIMDRIATKDIIFGIYFGVVLVMFLYNLFIYFTTKDRSYLFYVFYVLSVGLTQATFDGYTFKYLWPNSSWFSNHGLYIVGAPTGIFIALFARDFLQTRKYAPKLTKWLYVIASSYGLAFIVSFMDLYSLSYNIIDISGIFLTLYILYIAIKISLKGYRPAKIFLFAWSIFFIGIILFVLRSFGVLPYNGYTTYTMVTGSAIEFVLISLALADRINLFRNEKEEAQQETVSLLKENERIVREQNIILEEKVEERTDELNKTLTNLKETQSQLVDAEKMSSLGILTAGIAHEINNPINFVSSNIAPLRQDLDDLNTLITKYEEVIEEVNLPNKTQEINELKEELDYDYLKTELVSIIDGIESGATRTAEIVSGLRNFSRLDEVDLKKANINEGIESTLTLLKAKLNGVKLIKELGPIPTTECYPGKLNQVFMNVIGNAIQAIEHKKHDGFIKITTQLLDSFIYISIQDNGYGMDEKTKEKIFDPFFTTKDVGDGTGLGLSIAYSIIESHEGTIEVSSELEKGSTFTIKIPYKE